MMEVDDLRTVVTCLRELGLSYEEFCGILKDAVDDIRPVKRLVGNPYAESFDSWLIKAGIALVVFPDPTISDLIGSIMIAAGLIRRRMKQPTTADILLEFRDMTKSLKNIREELNYCPL